MLETAIYIIGFLAVSFGFVVFFGAPYVPTLGHDVKDVFKLYDFKKSDVFVDIGSGDGVLLRAVATKNVQAAIGYELNPWLYVISKFLCRQQKQIRIHFANFWHATLPIETTVVYTFLNGKYMPRLQRQLQNHVEKTGRPLHFISFGFKMENQKLLKTRGAMQLYYFAPLQTEPLTAII